MIKPKEHWENFLETLGIVEAPLKKVFLDKNYNLQNEISIEEKNYIFKDFCKYVVSSNLSKLVKANFTKEEILSLRDGFFCENLAIRLKIPVQYGGKYEFTNMFLTKKTPFDEIFDEFTITQISDFQNREGSKNLPDYFFTPFPQDSVFIPVMVVNYSGGSNKEGSLEQIASIKYLSSREV